MIKKYLKAAALILLSVSIIEVLVLYNNNKNLEEELSTAMTNQKAYVSENSSLKEEAKVFKLTIEQLNYYNDSIIQKMNQVRESLNIKDKNLKSLQYIKTTSIKTDTLIFRDTIFNNVSLKLDTIIKDNWYSLSIGLEYPNIIKVSPSFISEKYLVTNSKKETVNPPKKYWWQRLFQKKHTIIEVNIVERSPYIETNESKFIEIID
jgi:hypothetical protein